MGRTRARALARFTVDVEDWFHGIAPDPSRWSSFERRCHVGTEILLRLLEEADTKATFFVLGDVARHQPQVVRAIAAHGHEIGSHGMLHERVEQLGPDRFRRDLRESLDVLQDITGDRVTSYRAPYFSARPDCSWFFETLISEGITNDSSIFPAWAPYYGSPTARREPHALGPLQEWPISAALFLGLRIPFAGGAWFRFLGMRPFTILRHWHARSDLPLIFYIHPWELDPGQPRLAGMSRIQQVRHYHAIAKTETRLKRLLADVGFGPLTEPAAAPFRSNLPAMAC